MNFDDTSFFKRYEALVKVADQLFERISKEFPDEVKCKEGCADCCHALFDLTLIEALYLNAAFNRKYSGSQREALLEKANKADRSIAKIKRQAYNELREGREEAEILKSLAQQKVRCPLLNDDDRCDMYALRPITCRFYGIPTAIGGKGRTCGLSGFVPGRSYPTVHLDRIHEQLQQITAELVRDIGSNHIKLADLLMPLSMALITVFNEEFLGVEDVAEAVASAKGK